MKGHDASPESGPRQTRAATGARGQLKAVTARLDAEMLARIDAIAEARSTESRKVTRSEVLRELFSLGLPDVERRAPRGRHLKLLRPGSGSKPTPPAPGKGRRD